MDGCARYNRCTKANGAQDERCTTTSSTRDITADGNEGHTKSNRTNLPTPSQTTHRCEQQIKEVENKQKNQRESKKTINRQNQKIHKREKTKKKR
jgi:hypothetical protein